MKFTSNKISIILVYASRIVNSILSFLITYLATKKIGNTMLFGKYSYIMTIINYIALFLGFGFNDAIKNIIVNLRDKKKISQYTGLAYILNIIFCIIFSIALFIFIIYNKEIQVGFFLIIFAQSVILNDLLNTIAIAQKKIKIMILNNSLINITIVFLYFLINAQYGQYLSIYFGVNFLYTNIIFFLFIKPTFKNIKTNYYNLIKVVKQYGFNVYLGRIASVSTYDLDKIMIKMFATVNYVGFYNLGLSCTSPITMFSSSLTSVMFKDMANYKKLSKKIVILNISWLVIVSLSFMSIGKYLFIFIFGDKYMYVAKNFILFGILAFFSGLYIPYHDFLVVKGCGKYLRNTAFILTASNVIFNCLLIPRYKMVGAIYATIISLMVDNIAHYYYYKKCINDLNKESILIK